MGKFAHKDLTDQLLTDVETVIQKLCEENESETSKYEFTSVQFIRRVAKQNQGVYVQLLERSRQHATEDKWIINGAHEAIGSALYWYMNRAGWEQERIPKDELDIFLQPTDRVIYRPTA